MLGDTHVGGVSVRAQLRCNFAQNPNPKSDPGGRYARRIGDWPLQTGDAALLDLIRAAIRARGPLPFAWLMEQALYHPDHGYYSSGRCSIGRGGDFFTSVSVGPLFGRLLAAQFAGMWETLGRPREFTIVEQGAHGGQFAHDVLTAAGAAEGGAFFDAIRYTIVEPFPVLRERQTTTLAEFAAKVEWRPSLDELPPFCGVHFSNELLDALPVHLVTWTGSAWHERHVALAGDALTFVDLPLADGRLEERLALVPSPLPAGYQTEINLAALDWVESVALRLERGFVVAVDYGFPRDEFFAPHRPAGTLRASAAHRPVASPLEAVGHCDISAHVDWTSLAERAAQRGLQLAGFTDQHRFITGLLAAHPELAAPGDAKSGPALQTLLHPAHLGMKFQFLVLQKGIAAEPTLAGLRFARAPRISLGLLTADP